MAIEFLMTVEDGVEIESADDEPPCPFAEFPSRGLFHIHESSHCCGEGLWISRGCDGHR